jgi:hypothetical protein
MNIQNSLGYFHCQDNNMNISLSVILANIVLAGILLLISIYFTTGVLILEGTIFATLMTMFCASVAYFIDKHTL